MSNSRPSKPALKSLRHQWRNATDAEAAATEAAPDGGLFRAALGTVREMPKVPEPPRSPPRPPVARQSIRDEANVLLELKHGRFEGADVDGSALLEYLAPGNSPKLLKKLKRGQFAAADEIDLHMLTLDQAQAVLKQFLREARAEASWCVRVIHGKGQRSEAGPVLKSMVDRMLRQRSDVLAFASCKPGHGGTGALEVLLRPD